MRWKGASADASRLSLAPVRPATERAEHIADWVRITEGKLSGATCATKSEPGHGRGSTGGVRAAVRELGIDRSDAQRAVKIAGIADEAKAAARDAGLDDNQSALLAVARVPQAEQADKVREIAERGTARLAWSWRHALFAGFPVSQILPRAPRFGFAAIRKVFDLFYRTLADRLADSVNINRELIQFIRY